MAFSAVAFIAPNYRDFKNYWLKAYNPGTTTPKVMALDGSGTVQVAKLQLNTNGFIVSAGQALVVPYIDGPYDLWLFPTSTEADANNTSNAKRVADNIEPIGSTIINDLSQSYIFDTVAAYQASTIAFPIGKTIHLNDRQADFSVITGQSGDGSNEIPSTAVSQSILLVDGFQLLAKENGILPSTDITSSLNVLLQRAKDNSGASVGVESGSYDISGGVFIPHGCSLEGQGIPHTFTTYRDSAVFDINPAVGVNTLGIVLGESGTSTSLRNRAAQVKNIQVIGDTQQGIGFSTVDDDDAGNAANSFNLQLDKCTTHSTYVGFKLINTFNNILNQCTAISTDTGFLVTGSGAGGGTSSVYTGCLTYNSRIGWDFDAIGWGYSTLLACGADGCDIALRVNGASSRGSSIRNFGIENIEVNGTGVLIDIAGSGYVEIDGLNIGANDDVGTTYIKVNNAERTVIKNADLSSSIINSCTVYSQSNPSDAGRVTFEDSDWFASSTDNFGDIFEENVILKNMRINGRLYLHAVGGMDAKQQEATYTSSSSGELGVNAASKRVYSKTIIMKTSSAGSSRYVAGVPAYRTDNLPDWAEITFINGTDPLNPSNVGFRSEDHTAGTGIIRDPALSASTSITLSSVGDSVVLQKRPDGKLYQIKALNVGI
jgi:hypothetical protein